MSVISVTVERAAQRGALALLDRVEGRVDVAGRHEHPVRGAQVADGPAGVAGVPRDVDDGVPGLAGHGGEPVVEVAVGDDEGGAGGRVGAAAREARDVVTAPLRLLRDGVAEPGGSPEHEHPHRAQPTGRRRGPAGSRTADRHGAEHRRTRRRGSVPRGHERRRSPRSRSPDTRDAGEAVGPRTSSDLWDEETATAYDESSRRRCSRRGARRHGRPPGDLADDGRGRRAGEVGDAAGLAATWPRAGVNRWRASSCPSRWSRSCAARSTRPRAGRRRRHGDDAGAGRVRARLPACSTPWATCAPRPSRSPASATPRGTWPRAGASSSSWACRRCVGSAGPARWSPSHVTERHVGFDTYDVANQQGTSHRLLAGRPTAQRVTAVHHFRYVWPAECDLMAQLAGLELERRVDDWDGRAVHVRQHEPRLRLAQGLTSSPAAPFGSVRWERTASDTTRGPHEPVRHPTRRRDRARAGRGRHPRRARAARPHPAALPGAVAALPGASGTAS